MNITSAPGEGTTFELRVPVWRGKAEAGSGLEALGQFRADNFQVAIIDLGMTGMSRDVLSVKLRQLDPCLVTVLSTGWMLSESDASLGLFELHIKKPFHVTEIADLLNQATGLHRSRQALSPALPHSRFLRPVLTQQLAYVLGVLAVPGQFP